MNRYREHKTEVGTFGMSEMASDSHPPVAKGRMLIIVVFEFISSIPSVVVDGIYVSQENPAMVV